MTAKLIALYRRPGDPEVFNKNYFDTHLPLIAMVPGLKRTTVTRLTRTLMGEDFYMMAVMEFKDKDALKEGMKSREMAVAGDNLNSFAQGLVTLIFGEDEKNPYG